MRNLVNGFRNILLFILIGGFFPVSAQHQHRHQHRYRGGENGGGQLNIICSFSDYASIAEYISRSGCPGAIHSPWGAGSSFCSTETQLCHDAE